ncbi:MAG: hypothetical protein ACJAVV_002403 [Alphaproteobacteria bacterium]
MTAVFAGGFVVHLLNANVGHSTLQINNLPPPAQQNLHFHQATDCQLFSFSASTYPQKSFKNFTPNPT